MKNLKYKSKRYKDLIKSHKNETLNAIDAIKLLKKNKTVKFKESIDLSFNSFSASNFHFSKRSLFTQTPISYHHQT